MTLVSQSHTIFDVFDMFASATSVQTYCEIFRFITGCLLLQNMSSQTVIDKLQSIYMEDIQQKLLSKATKVHMSKDIKTTIYR